MSLTFAGRARLGAAVMLVAVALTSPLVGAVETVPNFDLPRFGSDDGRVRLADYAGQVLVLDFFAHWCRPCKRVSQLLEREVAAYYRERGGNARGVPVTVVAVNVEAAQPELTAKFIAESGADVVADDSAGRLLQHFKGRALPFLVVLDLSGYARVVLTQAGLDEATVLREVIDGIGGTAR